MQAAQPGSDVRSRSGIQGLDHILRGGFPQGELCLLVGEPGTGKTTLGLQFLLHGLEAGEAALYLTLSQTRRGLEKIARSHEWSLGGIDVCEPLEGGELPEAEQTLFHPADVELGEVTEAVREAVERHRPRRAVFDSIAAIRLLADGPLRYRRQLLLLKRLFARHDCTVLFLDDGGAEEAGGGEFQSLAHGVIDLQKATPEYGDVRRRLQVTKMRGMPYQEGYHNFRIRAGGLDVYPRLEAPAPTSEAEREVVKSGIDRLDELLGGGLRAGTSCLIIGPTGTGKTSLALCYAYAEAKRGRAAKVYTFDERLDTFYARAEGLGMDVRSHVEGGRLGLRRISAGESSPGEFAQAVRRDVEDGGVRLVVLDSLTGYVNAMLQEELLVTQMHELLSYLSQRGVLTLLVMAQHRLLGDEQESPVNVSYMTDSLILLRHFEAGGSLRRAISVVKKRHGRHEHTIREIRMTSEGIEVGEAVERFSGVLDGTPTYEGEREDLL